MKVNLKTLAATAGLSQTTVSRALGGYSDVSATTRNASPGRAANGLPARSAGTPAGNRPDRHGGHDLSVPRNRIRRHRWGEVIAGLSEALGEHGMDLSIIPVLPRRNSRPTAA